MPIKTGTMYLVKCEKCDWSENFFIRKGPVPFLPLSGGKDKLPKKCPECGGKASSQIDIGWRQ